MRRRQEAMQRGAKFDEAAFFKRLYDTEVVAKAGMENALAQARAIIAGLVLQANIGGVTLVSSEVMELLENGAATGVDTQNVAEGLVVSVIFADEEETTNEEAE